MTISGLGYIEGLMASLNIPYAFMQWKGDVPEAYWTGEYQETDSITYEEDGCQESTFILNGFTRKSKLSLEKDKEKLKKELPKTAILDDGSGIAVFYGNALPIPTGNAELNRIQINLTIKEWGY